MAAKMGRPDRRDAGGTTLFVDVLIGIPGAASAAATLPLILKGIRERAELEVRERPELERIRIAVHPMDPADFNPQAGTPPLFRHVRGSDRRGAILIHPLEESAAAWVARRIMAVSVLARHGRLGVDAIDIDDGGAISSMVGRLHAAGHARIGFLSGDRPAGCRQAARRFGGYAKELGARGLKLNRDWVLNARRNGPRLEPSQAAEIAALRTRESGVTAWVCAEDHHAYQLIQRLEAAGLRVPQDCSVTGFGGIEPPAGLPRATSLRAPHEHIGSSALTRMVNRVMYPSSPRRKILVEAQFVPGETVASPRRP
jgi:LacI family transcriptional regulator